MAHDTLITEYHAIARELSAQSYLVIDGYGKVGFWVRNPDMTKLSFVNGHSFVSFRKAKVLFLSSERP